MMIRIERIFLIMAISFALMGCRSSREEELESQVAVLQSQLEDIRSKLKEAQLEVGTLRSAVDDLDNAIEQFRYSDWRTVVPNVQSAVSDVDDATGSLEITVMNLYNVAQ